MPSYQKIREFLAQFLVLMPFLVSSAFCLIFLFGIKHSFPILEVSVLPNPKAYKLFLVLFIAALSGIIFYFRAPLMLNFLFGPSFLMATIFKSLHESKNPLIEYMPISISNIRLFLFEDLQFYYYDLCFANGVFIWFWMIFLFMSSKNLFEQRNALPTEYKRTSKNLDFMIIIFSLLMIILSAFASGQVPVEKTYIQVLNQLHTRLFFAGLLTLGISFGMQFLRLRILGSQLALNFLKCIAPFFILGSLSYFIDSWLVVLDSQFVGIASALYVVSTSIVIWHSKSKNDPEIGKMNTYELLLGFIDDKKSPKTATEEKNPDDPQFEKANNFRPFPYELESSILKERQLKFNSVLAVATTMTLGQLLIYMAFSGPKIEIVSLFEALVPFIYLISFFFISGIQTINLNLSVAQVHPNHEPFGMKTFTSNLNLFLAHVKELEKINSQLPLGNIFYNQGGPALVETFDMNDIREDQKISYLEQHFILSYLLYRFYLKKSCDQNSLKQEKFVALTLSNLKGPIKIYLEEFTVTSQLGSLDGYTAQRFWAAAPANSWVVSQDLFLKFWVRIAQRAKAKKSKVCSQMDSTNFNLLLNRSDANELKQASSTAELANPNTWVALNLAEIEPNELGKVYPELFATGLLSEASLINHTAHKSVHS